MPERNVFRPAPFSLDARRWETPWKWGCAIVALIWFAAGEAVSLSYPAGPHSSTLAQHLSAAAVTAFISGTLWIFAFAVVRGIVMTIRGRH